MTDETPINLNKIRKARAREDARKSANENAVKFGRSKAQRLLESTSADKVRAHLDNLKFEEDGDNAPS